MATLSYPPPSSDRWHSTREESRDTMEAASDLLGVRVPSDCARGASSDQPIKTVDIRGQPYRLPPRVDKEFYRDLTYLEDEEIIGKYRLEPCRVEDYPPAPSSTESSPRRSIMGVVDSKRRSLLMGRGTVIPQAAKDGHRRSRHM